MVNPVPEKGADITVELARHHRRHRFVLQEGWYPVSLDLPSNVEYRPQTPDLTSLRQETHVLLVPSRVREGFGRVAVEFALEGVPAIAHAIGGLPEAVDGGGILLPSLAVPDWIEAVAAMDREDYYRELAESAYNHARVFLRDAVTELVDRHVLS